MSSTSKIFAMSSAQSLGCVTQSQPNPIAAQYPDKTTGALNGTIAILPINFTLARSIIPSNYNILEDAYRELLPDFPAGMYPAMLQLQLDHDVGTGGLTVIQNFQRAGISFPFVDRLEDGYTSMAYGDYLLVSADQPVPLAGAALYGNTIVPATFSPSCNAYAYTPASTTGETYFNAYVAPKLPGQKPGIGSTFAPLAEGDASPYSMAFWKNVTNQPQFSKNVLFCDNFIRLFNTTSNLPPYEPTPVKGNVNAVKPFFAKETTFQNVYGLNVANGFIENNYMSCDSLKGYSGTGSGD